MSAASNINELLSDKLFQVIGSTPTSIAESLRKVDLKGKRNEGAQIFAIAVFSAAVNKSTLETFLADSRFANIRPLLSAALSIQGRANMTALTLLGHCLMTTDMASQVSFTSEFRKKMGQNHLWAGSLDSGSLSAKQKEILKEKQRLTKESEARALGNGFLKHVGILSEPMDEDESALFGIPESRSTGAQVTSSVSPKRASPTSPSRIAAFRKSTSETVEMPADVLNYRRNIVGQSDADIAESIDRNGLDVFIANTQRLMVKDPTGKGVKGAGSTIR